MYMIFYWKVSDKTAYANSAEADQTACDQEVWSGSTLFAIPLSILRNTCTKIKILSKNKYRIKSLKF